MQPSEQTTGFIAAKSRFEQKKYSDTQTGTGVCVHVSQQLIALADCLVKTFYGWLDSLVALHWNMGEGT